MASLPPGFRLLHVPYCYYPDPVGGTEVYVASLARVQKARSYEVAIAAPAEQNRTYFHDGLSVNRFGIAGKIDLRQLYGEGDPTAAANFQKILDRFRPDVLHLHAFTSAVSASLAHLARSSGFPSSSHITRQRSHAVAGRCLSRETGSAMVKCA